MAARIDLKRINGNLLSWGSGIIKIGGARIAGIEECDFGDKRVRELVWGMSRDGAPIGRTRGEYQPDEGRILVLKHTAKNIRQALASSMGSTSYGDAEFDIDLDFREDGDAGNTSIQLLSCTISGDKSSKKRGPSPLMDDLGLQYKFIKRDGLTLYSAEVD